MTHVSLNFLLAISFGLLALMSGGLYGMYVSCATPLPGGVSLVRRRLPEWYIFLYAWVVGCVGGFCLRHSPELEPLWRAFGPWVVGPGACTVLMLLGWWGAPLIFDLGLAIYERFTGSRPTPTNRRQVVLE